MINQSDIILDFEQRSDTNISRAIGDFLIIILKHGLGWNRSGYIEFVLYMYVYLVGYILYRVLVEYIRDIVVTIQRVGKYLF